MRIIEIHQQEGETVEDVLARVAQTVQEDIARFEAENADKQAQAKCEGCDEPLTPHGANVEQGLVFSNIGDLLNHFFGGMEATTPVSETDANILSTDELEAPVRAEPDLRQPKEVPELAGESLLLEAGHFYRAVDGSICGPLTGDMRGFGLINQGAANYWNYDGTSRLVHVPGLVMEVFVSDTPILEIIEEMRKDGEANAELAAEDGYADAGAVLLSVAAAEARDAEEAGNFEDAIFALKVRDWLRTAGCMTADEVEDAIDKEEALKEELRYRLADLVPAENLNEVIKTVLAA